MANNVYIGNRYVPLFDGDWRNNKTYEPLIIVSYGNNSYTSKRPVPLNTPPTTGGPDDPYWALTGNYNGQIADLYSRINAADGNITSLEGRMDTAEQGISVLNNAVANMTGEYIVWIGDSYTQASSLGGNQDKRFSTLVSSWLGLTEKNYAVGGTSFNFGPTPYTTQAQNAVTDFNNNNLDKTKVRYVIIAGTRNDGIISGSQAAAYEATVQSTINTLADNFPNAEIIMFPMLWDCMFLPTAYLETIKRTKWAVMMSDHADRVQIVDYCYEWLSAQYCYILYQNGVNVHPNVVGHKIIAKHMYSAIFGKNFDTSSYLEIGPSWTAVATGNSRFTIDKTNHLIHIHLQLQTASSISTTTIFTHTVNLNGPVEEFSIGNQRIWSNFKTRNSVHNNVAMPVLPYYLDCTVNKTGDATGTLTYECKAYAGNMQPNEFYYDDIIIKNGVIDNNYTVS